MNVRQAIRDRIVNDAGTAALLATYETLPAVFSPVKPVDFNWQVDPAVLVRVPTQFDDDSPFQGARTQALVQVAVYAQLPVGGTDDRAVEDAALAIRQLFRGKGFVAADGLTYQAIVSGPIAAPTDSDELVGRLLQLRLNIGG